MKYEQAYYKAEHTDNWIEVKSSKLFNNIDLIASLRKENLFEKKHDSLNKLFIRNRKDCPHFYSRGINRSKINSAKESKVHDERIEDIYTLLNKETTKKIHFGFTDYSLYDNVKKNKEAIRFETVKKLSGYQWGKEVKYPINDRQYVEFDVFGRSKELNWTNNNPYFAIEVVDTHFTDQEAFSALIKLSKGQPLIVCYIFIKDRTYCFPPDVNSEKPEFQLTSKYYIQDGSFWLDDERMEEKYPVKECDFNNEKDYYNFLMEKVVKVRALKN